MPWAAPGTCSATRASVRTRTCTRSATASARGKRRKRLPTGRRSGTISVIPLGIRHRQQNPLRPAGAAGDVVARRGEVDPRSSGGGRKNVAPHLQISLYVQRLLRLQLRLYARLAGYGAIPRNDRASTEVAGGPRLHREARRGDRQRRNGSNARAGDDGQSGARSDAAALTDLRPGAAGERLGRGMAARKSSRARRLHDRALEERPGGNVSLPAVA